MMRRSGLLIALAALVGAGAASVVAAPAGATTLPLYVDFGVVVPGSTATDVQTVVVDHESVVAKAEWTPVAGPAGTRWDAVLCDAAGDCSAFADILGARVAAGTYTVSMSVTLPWTAEQGEIAASEGVVQLVDPAELAATGASTPWLAAVVGAVLAALGALLVLRRRPEGQER
ncbi:MAG: LPXTG cell wall anchor domain-containing protein [Microbacterium sp.]